MHFPMRNNWLILIIVSPIQHGKQHSCSLCPSLQCPHRSIIVVKEVVSCVRKFVCLSDKGAFSFRRGWTGRIAGMKYKKGKCKPPWLDSPLNFCVWSATIVGITWTAFKVGCSFLPLGFRVPAVLSPYRGRTKPNGLELSLPLKRSLDTCNSRIF